MKNPEKAEEKRKNTQLKVPRSDIQARLRNFIKFFHESAAIVIHPSHLLKTTNLVSRQAQGSSAAV